MPTKCSVGDCESYYSKGVPFYDVPSPLKYKFCSEKAELTKKRRKLWLKALGITDDSSDILRICSKHFVTGKPSTLEDSDNIDWVPTLHIRQSSSRKKIKNVSFTTKRRNSEKISHSHKENSIESKHSKSNRRSGQYGNKTQNKVKTVEGKKASKNVDLKKFVNCKVVMVRNIQCATFSGTNGSGLAVTQKHGNFNCDNVMLKEAAINNTVLRVHLVRQNLNELKTKYKSFQNQSTNKRKRQERSSFGREIKRTNLFFGVNQESRRSVEKKLNTPEIRKSMVRVNKVEPAKSREIRKYGVANKFMQKNEFKNSVDSKTLNRTIQKKYRDNIKINLFPPKENIKIVKRPSTQREFIRYYKNGGKEQTPSSICYLKFKTYLPSEEGTLDYSFQKLVTDVKHLKLPAPSWKIKVIIKQGKIGAITFTNKLSLERSVGFSANNNKYKITIDNKPAFLLGSPNHVQTSKDLEILLDIVQNIDSENPMLFYQ